MRDIVEMLDTAHVQEDRRWQERANCLGVDPDPRLLEKLRTG